MLWKLIILGVGENKSKCFIYEKLTKSLLSPVFFQWMAISTGLFHTSHKALRTSTAHLTCLQQARSPSVQMLSALPYLASESWSKTPKQLKYYMEAWEELWSDSSPN